MSAVRKEVADTYYIRCEPEHSWARVFMVEGRRSDGSGWGQLSIVSDYGNFGHTWTAIGERSFRDFLCGLQFDYVMDKLGRKRFDRDAAVKVARRNIIDKRRRWHEIDAAETRELYDAVDDINADTPDGWYHGLVDALGRRWTDWEAFLWDAPMAWSPDSLGLWKHIWPELIAQFKSEASA